MNTHTTGHLLQEFDRDWLVDHHHVFLLVLILGAQDLIHDATIVGQQNQAFGVFIQATDWENPRRVIDEVDDVAFNRRFSRTRDANRLVQCNIGPDRSPLLDLRTHDFAVHADFVSGGDLHAEIGRFAVEGHAALRDEAIGVAA